MKCIKKALILFIVVLCLFACNNKTKTRYADNLYQNKEKLLKIFPENISIVTRDKYKILILNFDRDSSISIRFSNFRIDEIKSLKILDTLDTKELKKVNECLNFSDTINTNDSLIEYVHDLLKTMDKLHLRDVVHDKKNLGIHTEFYISWEDRMIYVHDILKVNNAEWKKTLKTAKSYDDSWYYYNIYSVSDSD